MSGISTAGAVSLIVLAAAGVGFVYGFFVGRRVTSRLWAEEFRATMRALVDEGLIAKGILDEFVRRRIRKLARELTRRYG